MNTVSRCFHTTGVSFLNIPLPSYSGRWPSDFFLHRGRDGSWPLLGLHSAGRFQVLYVKDSPKEGHSQHVQLLQLAYWLLLKQVKLLHVTVRFRHWHLDEVHGTAFPMFRLQQLQPCPSKGFLAVCGLEAWLCYASQAPSRSELLAGVMLAPPVHPWTLPPGPVCLSPWRLLPQLCCSRMRLKGDPWAAQVGNQEKTQQYSSSWAFHALVSVSPDRLVPPSRDSCPAEPSAEVHHWWRSPALLIKDLASAVVLRKQIQFCIWWLLPEVVVFHKWADAMPGLYSRTVMSKAMPRAAQGMNAARGFFRNAWCNVRLFPPSWELLPTRLITQMRHCASEKLLQSTFFQMVWLFFIKIGEKRGTNQQWALSRNTIYEKSACEKELLHSCPGVH